MGANSISGSFDYRSLPPDLAVLRYMHDNDCDEGAAREALYKMYGPPASYGDPSVSGIWTVPRPEGVLTNMPQPQGFGVQPQMNAHEGAPRDPDSIADEVASLRGITAEEAKTKLLEILGEPVQGGRPQLKPEEIAQKYADAFNISVEDAEKELKELFPAPPNPPQADIRQGFGVQPQMNAHEGAPRDPDSIAGEVASLRGITAEEAKTKLLEILGEPVQGGRPQLKPEEIAQKYADAFNISVEDAEKELEELFPAPPPGRIYNKIG